MEKVAAVLATIAVGALVAFQPPVNSQLAKHTSVLGAAFVSAALAGVVMAFIALFAGAIPSPRVVADLPVGYLTGGLIGAVLITVSLVTVRILGAGGVVAATVAGQLIVSALLDRAGVLGLDRVGLTPTRLLGFALLLLGTAFVTAR
jgi:transporter family-2 protein